MSSSGSPKISSSVSESSASFICTDPYPDGLPENITLHFVLQDMVYTGTDSDGNPIYSLEDVATFDIPLHHNHDPFWSSTWEFDQLTDPPVEVNGYTMYGVRVLYNSVMPAPNGDTCGWEVDLQLGDGGYNNVSRHRGADPYGDYPDMPLGGAVARDIQVRL